MSWSSPPMVARTAPISGSANAAARSDARASGDAPSCLVVGYSTGSTPISSRSRRIATSWTAGKRPGAANDGDSTATRSPVASLAGTVSSGGTRLSQHMGPAAAHEFPRHPAPEATAATAQRGDRRRQASWRHRAAVVADADRPDTGQFCQARQAPSGMPGSVLVSGAKRPGPDAEWNNLPPTVAKRGPGSQAGVSGGRRDAPFGAWRAATGWRLACGYRARGLMGVAEPTTAVPNGADQQRGIGPLLGCYPGDVYDGDTDAQVGLRT